MAQDAQPKTKLKRILSALAATLSAIFVLHELSQVCTWILLTIFLKSPAVFSNHFGWLSCYGTGLETISPKGLAFLSGAPILTAIVLNEISVALVRRTKEPFKTFFLFFQLAATTVVLFGVFTFLFCFAFEWALYPDWYLLAKQFHGRIEYKMLTAFFVAAATFSYCGTTLTRLKNNFSIDDAGSGPLPPLQPKPGESRQK